ELVSLMGGTLWVDSEVGAGSAFHFTARFDRQAADLVPEAPSDLHHLPVLAVDDNATNRRILEEVLRNWNMVPAVVGSGNEALRALESADREHRPFRLAIVDSQMPRLDGFRLVRQIKADRRFQAMPIIMLTSAARSDDV